MNVVTIRPIAVWSSSICFVCIHLWFEALWRRFRELTVDLIVFIQFLRSFSWLYNLINLRFLGDTYVYQEILLDLK